MASFQSVIRTGLLHVPQVDAAAGEALSKALIRSLRQVVIQQEGYAGHDRRWLEATLCKWCDEDELDLVITIGGTLPAPGPSALECVPEVTDSIIERQVPGLAEAMRAWAREEFPGASLHRGVAGIRGRTLIVNLPAGARAASLFLEAILEDVPYILAHLRGDAEAATLAQLIDVGMGDDGTADHTPGDALPNVEADVPQPKGKGLNAEDFAAFLRRGKEERD